MFCTRMRPFILSSQFPFLFYLHGYGGVFLVVFVFWWLFFVLFEFMDFFVFLISALVRAFGRIGVV